jgi:hypothetical protein
MTGGAAGEENASAMQTEEPVGSPPVFGCGRSRTPIQPSRSNSAVINRVRIPVPRRGDDPELVCQQINDVLSKSTLPYPPMRDIDGNMVKLRMQPGGLPRGMHLLTPHTANKPRRSS